MTRERPILFSAPMVRAILAGTKTQTRRSVKPPRGYRWLDLAVGTMVNDGGHKKHISDLRSPYGEPGDRLWVRETWAYGTHAMNAKRDEDGPFVYAADNYGTQGRLCDRWRPSIHMPRAASRITLEITGVRVERLQDISEADARAEGIGRYDNGTFGLDDPAACMGPSAAVAYMRLWNHINGPDSWGANPWVWCLEFRRLA